MSKLAQTLAKASEQSVDYSPGMGSTRCKNCQHFEPPASCEVVAGEIDPEYWCKRFKAK